MSHCRFENTSHDLMDCYEHMDDERLGEAERRARHRLIQTCCNIAREFSDEVEK